MPLIDLVVGTPVTQTARVQQLNGLFDVPPADRAERRWSVDLPTDSFDWQVGLIVGPSGSGKSTLARAAFGNELVSGYDWPADRAVVDGFAAGLGIKDITAALSSVGFSTPPAWVRPFHTLSNGEQFRAFLARTLLDPRPVVAVDEFTSVVDRTVAKIGSAAVAKAVRRTPGKKFVAVTCHADVEEWLCPDWVVVMPSGEFARRSLRRPDITLEVRRVHSDAWGRFKHHHYLDTTLNKAAKCFAAFWDGRAVAFTASLAFPHPVRPGWREHRTVCLPDFQGVGIGNTLSEFVAGVMRCLGPYRSTTGNPAMIRHRAKSSVWKMTTKPTMNGRQYGGRSGNKPKFANANFRNTAGFEYVGPRRPDDARRMGII